MSSIWLYISFNAAVAVFKSGSTKQLGMAAINLIYTGLVNYIKILPKQLVGFLYNLRVQYISGSILFMPVTSETIHFMIQFYLLIK